MNYHFGWLANFRAKSNILAISLAVGNGGYKCSTMFYPQLEFIVAIVVIPEIGIQHASTTNTQVGGCHFYLTFLSALHSRNAWLLTCFNLFTIPILWWGPGWCRCRWCGHRVRRVSGDAAAGSVLRSAGLDGEVFRAIAEAAQVRYGWTKIRGSALGLAHWK